MTATRRSGARPLKRLISDSIEDRLSEMLLSGLFVAGDTVVVDKSPDEGGGLAIETAKQPRLCGVAFSATISIPRGATRPLSALKALFRTTRLTDLL